MISAGYASFFPGVLAAGEVSAPLKDRGALERLRITFLLPDYPWRPIGGFRVVYEYANRLVSRGHSVAVVHARRCPVPKGGRLRQPFSLKDAVRPAARFARARLVRARLEWHKVDPRVDLRFVPDLMPRHIPAGDVVVATSWRTAAFASSYDIEKGQKFYLLQHHETWDGSPDLVNATWRLPMKKIVIARWLERVGRDLGVPPDEMRYIPNGIDRSVYALTSSIAERPLRVASLCHPAEWKGSRDAVAALEIAKSEVPNLEAVMFGTTPRPAWVPQWIDYWRDPPQDMLVSNLYNGSAVYLCASWAEGWHLPPAEAMACGCAVVSTRIDGVADFAVDGRTALLAPPRDAGTLAEHVVRLLRHNDLRTSLAQAGYDHIAQFDWEKSTSALECWFLENSEPCPSLPE